jgi:DNA-binding MarR family transcriptional regulator
MTGREHDDGLVRQWAAVVRAVEIVQQAAAVRLDKIGMSAPYFWVLMMLLEAEDRRLSMSRIARDLSMTSGGFTKLADRMARDGLIDRRGSAGDRRVVFAALTEAGQEQALHADEAYRAFLRNEVLHVVSDEDLATLATIAARLSELHRDPDPDASFERSPRPGGQPERRSTNEPEPRSADRTATPGDDEPERGIADESEDPNAD